MMSDSDLEDKELELATDLEEQLKKIKRSRRRDTLMAWGSSVGVSMGGSAEAVGENLEKVGEHLSETMHTFDRAVVELSGVLAKDKDRNKEPKIIVDNSYHIKNFAGKKPTGGTEITFKKWRRQVKKLQEDETISDAQRKRIVMKSIVGDAEESIQTVSVKPLAEIIVHLEAVYGTVVSMEDLECEFKSRNQVDNESASEYLTVLHSLYGEMVTEQTDLISGMPEAVMKQYCRGTSDEELLTKLGWDTRKRGESLTIIQMFEQLRLAEARRLQRKLRSRKVVESKQQQASVEDSEELVKLRKRIDQLEVEKEKVKIEPESVSSPEIVLLQQRLAELEKQKPMRGKFVLFCYRCGEDLHRASECNNVGNQEKVRQKLDDRWKAKLGN